MMRCVRVALNCFVGAVLCGFPALAQFSSGSTGSDGALDYTGKCPGNSVNFDPRAFTPPLDPAHDNIFNFTTITIPGGCTVLFSQSILNGPVVWLATGNVTINGTLQLQGNGGGPNFPTSLRVLSTPGAGGYPGGAAGNGSNPPGAGFGPGGGAGSATAAVGGKYTGNQFVIPLVGGSGGGGSTSNGGGAGGGAILIASSTQISNSTIFAYGGNGNNCSAGGSGGAVRLVAPVVSAGTINATGGNGGGCSSSGGTGGAVRIESFNNPGGSYSVNGGSGNSAGTVTFGSPYNTFATSSVPPTLQVTSVGGVVVASPSTGSFQVPDVVINTGNPVNIQIQGSQIPSGTVATLVFYSDNGPDMTLTATLSGTLSVTTGTAQFTFPPGYTRGYVYATFTP